MMVAQNNFYEELAKALIEVARLHSKLKKYGRHLETCIVHMSWSDPGKLLDPESIPKCTCGFSAALQGGSDGR